MQKIAKNHDSTLANGDFVQSPCISICQMSPNGLCEGCFRTLDEIAAWGRLAQDAKRQVLQRVEERVKERVRQHEQTVRTS